MKGYEIMAISLHVGSDQCEDRVEYSDIVESAVSNIIIYLLIQIMGINALIYLYIYRKNLWHIQLQNE